MTNGKTKSGAGSVGAAAIIGAAVGAGAVILSDKHNRQKIKSEFDKAMDKGEKTLNQVRAKVDSARDDSQKKLDHQIAKAQKSAK